ncbi:MAG: MFS transporter [Candidatus Woesearchaeota archaeon]|nr:MFS transporter [Candidatus Woesearchaeota archaeon]
MSFFKRLKEGITRNVIFIGLVSFFMDTSSEMIFSILPLFLMNVLHATAPIIGLIEGVAESTASILKFASGWLSDRCGKRKLFLYIGYGFSALFKPLFALANTWPVVLAARFGDWTGKGIRGTVRDAMLADSSEKRYRGKVFGLHRVMDKSGAIAGPLLAMLLFSFLGYKGIFWIAVIPALLAVLMILPIRVREKCHEEGFDSKKISFSLKGIDRKYKRFLLIVALFSFANFSYAFFMLRAQDIGVKPELVITMYLFLNIVYSLSAMPFGILSDRIGRKNVIAAGFFLFTLMMLGFAFATTVIQAFILFAMYGIFMSIFEGVPKAFVSDLVKEEKRGTALGLFNGITGIIVLPASLIAGLLWQYANPAMPFFLGAGISVISLIMLIFFV